MFSAQRMGGFQDEGTGYLRSGSLDNPGLESRMQDEATSDEPKAKSHRHCSKPSLEVYRYLQTRLRNTSHCTWKSKEESAHMSRCALLRGK